MQQSTGKWRLLPYCSVLGPAQTLPTSWAPHQRTAQHVKTTWATGPALMQEHMTATISSLTPARQLSTLQHGQAMMQQCSS
jgi:hypothetical protein